MCTLEASLSKAGFYFGVIVPPVVFFGLVQLWANGIQRGEIGAEGFFVLLALAQLFPLAALLWILLSTAAYTIAPGKIIVHHVMYDREIPLNRVMEAPALKRGVITLRAERTLRIRVPQPEQCMRLLEAALGPQPPQNAW